MKDVAAPKIVKNRQNSPKAPENPKNPKNSLDLLEPTTRETWDT
jgi:hypothetical protein